MEEVDNGEHELSDDSDDDVAAFDDWVECENLIVLQIVELDFPDYFGDLGHEQSALDDGIQSENSEERHPDNEVVQSDQR